MKRNQPIIDLTADSDGDDTNAISNATSSTSRIPPPQTSKESKSRKRTRAGERSKSASRSNSTHSTRSSSVVSAHSTQQQPHKGKSKPVQEAQEAPHDDIDGRPVFNNLTCPICFDVVSNACTTACGHIACANCLFDYFEGERIKNEGISLPRPIQQARQRSQKLNAKARLRTDYAARTYMLSDNPDHTFQGPCPICRTELMGGWGEAVIPLYVRTLDLID
ncbi:hypothetical protein E3P94_03319 [Wallemia ichthyophaga]|nr:hypothetical protein E3P95_03260 [Wallemia ichthyophaga]TIA97420.1 hypothetical protein E3P94_03319 [Wallemia ichthyophaga]